MAILSSSNAVERLILKECNLTESSDQVKLGTLPVNSAAVFYLGTPYVNDGIYRVCFSSTQLPLGPSDLSLPLETSSAIDLFFTKLQV